MPNIRSSADLRNNYNDISSYCHAYNEPVFITKNGKGDLAVMSMETYEEMAGRIVQQAARGPCRRGSREHAPLCRCYG